MKNVFLLIACLVGASSPANPYAKWQHGPPHDAGFFPIAVWLQDPRNAGQYRAAGINTYVGLWQGPTEDQLAELRRMIGDPQNLRDICGTEGQLCGQCPFGAYLPSGFPYASERQALCLPWIVVVHPQPTAAPSKSQ